MKTTLHSKSTIAPSVTGPIRCPPLRRVLVLVPLVLGCFGLVSPNHSSKSPCSGLWKHHRVQAPWPFRLATFEYFSPDGCIETFVSVDVTQSTPEARRPTSSSASMTSAGRSSSGI
jgi:hypothetical protein